jgi:hypothetical protein
MEQYDGVQLMQTRLEKDNQLTYIAARGMHAPLGAETLR